MNIIPLVFSFLLVLAFSSIVLLKERKSTTLESKSYFDHMHAVREMRNLLEQEEFNHFHPFMKEEKKAKDKAKTPPVKIDPSLKAKRTKKERDKFEKDKETRRSSIYSRFNLFPLLDHKEEKLMQAATSLITSLYGHVPFFKEKEKENPMLAQDIVLFFLDKAKKTESAYYFPLFLKEESHLKAVLYKMIKGTNAYDTKIKKGYPPLEDFFCFDPAMPKAIHFHFASLPLLEVLFGKEMVAAIEGKEEEKWEARDNYFYLKIDELRELLQKKHKNINDLNALEAHINFSNSPPKEKTLRTSETSSQIRLKQRVPGEKSKE